MGRVSYANKIRLKESGLPAQNSWRDVDSNEVKDAINDNADKIDELAAGLTDTTWVELVALTTRDNGQRYNITTANPADGIIYGNIILLSKDTFIHIGTGEIEYTIKIK